jgi:myo-inositol-1(or 4)-monophosphatase
LNYLAGMPVVAVNVALQERGKPLVAAVGDPFGDAILWTDGTRASLRRGARDTQLIPAAGSGLVDLNLDPPYPNEMWFRAADVLGDPRFVRAFRPRVVSSSIALAWVATGQRAAYVTDGDVTDSVHFAAGIALCQAAGCRVADLRGGAVRPGAPGLVAAADLSVSETILELIASR